MITTWQEGDRIRNRWEIHRILHGGMGIVYIVYDHEFHEFYAAKSFRDEVFAGNPATADLFEREAIAWVKLDLHPNITQARFVQTIEGKPYLFLEYVSGGDLSGWIGTPRLTEDLPQVLHFAIQFCDGMKHALSKGIKAHRDLKPQNCLITQDRTLKITDFGLARVVAMQEGEGGRGGTAEYMPPEQWGNFQQADERADIYSFGATVYEMVTGQCIFGARPAVAVEELRGRHISQQPPALKSQVLELDALVQICLAKDPARRFSNFSEARERMAQIYEKLTGETAPLPATGKELDAMQLGNKGVSLSNFGREDEALVCFNRVLDLAPHDERAWSNKGLSLRALGHNEKALGCYDRAIEINPRFELAWINKGTSLYEMGRYEEALICCDRALEINPRHERAWTNRGVSLTALNRTDEAIVCCDHALKLNPRFEHAWNSKGVALFPSGRLEEALVCYDKALEINVRFERAWMNKGVALGMLGRVEALACLEEAHRLGAPKAALAIALFRQKFGQR